MSETISNELATARAIVEQTGVNLFLTGKAGTGKTTFLRSLSASTSKRHVILAPTGVAAINAGGSTIHSFFQLSFGPMVPGASCSEKKSYYKMSRDKLRLIRTLDLIIIDEISMVRPDLLDAVDETLRRFRNPVKPFGGVQLLMIGDLRQLAPVAQDAEWEMLKDYYSSPYFFESMALKQAGFLTVELTKVYRQDDQHFVDILNRIRDNRADADTLAELNRRADRTLFPADDSGYIRLTTHNYRANRINEERLAMLDTQEFVYDADIKGNFPESAYPADPRLVLKTGAQVMFVKNDPSGARRYYNGLLGEVMSLDEGKVLVRPRTPGMPEISVSFDTWQNTRYKLNATGDIVEEVEGSFSQIPLRPAWAITIHKSQGLTFDRAIVDAGHSFAPGQTYVALSRCRSLDGLLLDMPLSPGAIMTDSAVSDFISRCASAGGEDAIEVYKKGYFADLLKEMFDFSLIRNALEGYQHDVLSTISGMYPNYLRAVDDCRTVMETEVKDVARKLYAFFAATLPGVGDADAAARLSVKIKGGCAWFEERLSPLAEVCARMPAVIDNSRDERRVKRSRDALLDLVDVKIRVLQAFREKEFDTMAYLQVKADALLNASSASRPDSSGRKGLAKPAKEPARQFAVRQDVENPELYDLLCEWRRERAGGKPAYTVLPNVALMDIASLLPRDRGELMSVAGMGKKRCSEYGEELIEIVNQYLNTL